MHCFQSSNTFDKYFPGLGLGKDAPLLIEPPHDLFSPNFSICLLVSEILRPDVSKTASCLVETNCLVYFRTLASRASIPTTLQFACIPRIGSIRTHFADAGEEKEEEKCCSEKLASAEGKDKRKNSWNDLPKFLLAGAVSTIISRTCIAPLERLKLECIVQGSKYSWVNILRCIWVTEGLRGFWKGNALNLFRMVPFKSINFICYDLYLANLLSVPGKEGITNRDRLIGGGISGIVATVLCIPLDTIRTRLVAPGGKALGGVAGCFCHMVQKEGFLSLYKGLTPALISMAPASAVFYAAYDMLKSSSLSHKKKMSGGETELGPIRTLIYGAIAGACAETVTYPLEVIRRKLQLQQAANFGLASAFILQIESDGVGSLFSGLFPSTLQVLPSAAFSYFFYETMKSILKIN
ncbi:probable mitochondrial adenine nucleotide transporter BTL3 isoform X2 [Elaeis guineensis]|uniref:Probable mitochondrial adenine nucleotide transporter BTL3 isoform X2 n=1 Tax=Elaeis guineensis var. tenera TaxID=51953 RepID=A0A6I9QTY5_ELAGV|nr:probable mitochondrial adenine nucleotide transporter BTL3 isoform X2 [Elaeis guineensis]